LAQQPNKSQRTTDKRLISACFGMLALLFQLATPIMLQAAPVDSLPPELRIICTPYGLSTVPEKSGNTEALQNFCPDCQLQELTLSLGTSAVSFKFTRSVQFDVVSYIDRTEPAHIRQARLPGPRSPPAV